MTHTENLRGRCGDALTAALHTASEAGPAAGCSSSKEVEQRVQGAVSMSEVACADI